MTEAPPMPPGWAWIPWSWPHSTCWGCGLSFADEGYERQRDTAVFCPVCAQRRWARDQQKRHTKAQRKPQARFGHNQPFARRHT